MTTTAPTDEKNSLSKENYIAPGCTTLLLGIGLFLGASGKLIETKIMEVHELNTIFWFGLIFVVIGTVLLCESKTKLAKQG